MPRGNRMTKWIMGELALTPHRDADKASNPIRLTPGQFAELWEELGAFPKEVNGYPVVELQCDLRALHENVVLGARLDLFAEAENGLQMVSLANSVTSTPDNIGCCEVLSVGGMVSSVKVGDLVFIDLCDVKQGYLCKNEECYVAPDGVFRARYDAKTQEVMPFENYVITNRAHERFGVAVHGTDRYDVVEYRKTEGIVSGKTSNGATAANVLYESVVSIGKLTNRPRPGLMTRAERYLLDGLCGNPPGWSKALELAWSEVVRERERGRDPDFAPGELVQFCRQLATPIRVRGEFLHLVPYESCLSTIDDEAILQRAIAEGRAGKLELAEDRRRIVLA